MTNEQLWALAREGDQDAVTRLINNVMPSIRYMAREIRNLYRGMMLEEDDLVQEASIGFLKAVETYDQKTGNRFLTYVKAVAENAMMDYVRKSISGLLPSGSSLSFDAPPPSYDPADGVAYGDIIPDGYSRTPEQLIIRKETITEVRNAMEMISARERAYLRYRYGFEDGRLHTRARCIKNQAFVRYTLALAAFCQILSLNTTTSKVSNPEKSSPSK